MRFVGNGDASDVSRCFPGVGMSVFLNILQDVSALVGDQTRERMIAAIGNPRGKRTAKSDIPFWDTPIFGDYYVYLWFDKDGDLFYIGKGCFGRAWDLRSRSDDFRKMAEGGHCFILASNMSEDYSLDLEKILILETVRQGKPLLNRTGGDALDAIDYCSGHRDHLLWYWDHLGVISRFSEKVGFDVFYDARGSSYEELGERFVWWDPHRELKTNDPVVLAEIRESEEKKRKRREYQRRYAEQRRNAV